MSDWGSTIIRVVEAGTEVEGPDGDGLTVEDYRAVQRRGEIFVTPTIYEALKRHPDIKHTFEPLAALAS